MWWLGSAGGMRRCWVKVGRAPQVLGISHLPLLLGISITRNSLGTGQCGIKSQMGTKAGEANVLISTRNPLQVLAALHHLQQESKPCEAQLSRACAGNPPAQRLPTNTNRNVKIHLLHLVLYSPLKYMTKLCFNTRGEAI